MGTVDYNTGEVDIKHLLGRTFISAGVPVLVQLMILLGIPPLSRRFNQGRYRLILPPLLTDFIRYFFSNPLLFFAVCEYRTSVWGSDVWALPVGLGGVVHTVEEFDEPTI
jgi:hypothetical protein